MKENKRISCFNRNAKASSLGRREMILEGTLELKE